MPESSEHSYLTSEEAETRIRALSAADCVRLERIARTFADGTGWLPNDLLQEALVATLTRRQWRSDLDVTVFLTGVMRSLAYSRRKSAKLDPLANSATARGGSVSDELEIQPGDKSLEPSEVVAEEQEAEHLLRSLAAWFESDDEVLTVLRGRIRGDNPAEIRIALGMDQTQYESVCRRMLRGYESLKKDVR